MLFADTHKQIQGNKAAQAILTSRGRNTSLRSGTKPLSLRAAARLYNVSTSEVFRQLKRLEDGSHDTNRPRGRPRALSEAEDDALVAYVMWMERAGFPASKKQVEEAANTLRLQRDPKATPLSKTWYAGFRKDHPQLRRTFLKAIEKSRKSFEASDITDITTFYKELEQKISCIASAVDIIFDKCEETARHTSRSLLC
ncbi:hypothetical protein AUP68_08539 [Ilyonectria robusta]